MYVGGGGNERLSFYLGKVDNANLVLEERVSVRGKQLAFLPNYATTRLQINIDKGYIPSIGLSYICVPKGCIDAHAPYIYDAWVYRISKDQKFEQFFW